MIKTFSTSHRDQKFTADEQQNALNSLEHGEVLYFPQLAFTLLPHETQFLSEDCADPRSKNISYYKHRLSGTTKLTETEQHQLSGMLERFSHYANHLIKSLLPHYAKQLIVGRASFRPVEISNRVTSYRKDDKRLHVDAFPSAPNQGQRILRVFSNINPDGEDRLWRLGEPFEKVARYFFPKFKKPLAGSANILRLLKITKSHRTLYDHYMLQLHDCMKLDSIYQQNADQQHFPFAASSSWIVQTDHVSHAAMKGKFALEQTFYLPVQAMQNEWLSPLRILERLLQKRLT